MRFGRVKSNLKIGLVGLPNVGKSSLFNLLTKQSAPAENFPFCTIDPNEARCSVPDERYDFLCDIWKPPSMQPAYLHVTDIAGLVRGAAEGQGLGNQFLSHILAVDGLFHLVRFFEDDEVTHVDGVIDPVRDLETVQRELCNKDLECVRNKMQAEHTASLKRSMFDNNKPEVVLFNTTAEKIVKLLEMGIPVRAGEFSSSEILLINDKFPLLTTKPCVYVANMSKELFLKKKSKWFKPVMEWINAHGGGSLIPISVALEEESVTPALPKLIKAGYHELNLIHFITAGEKEVRAWTVYNGATAVEASAVIHTDFAKAFIKAEVCSFDDFKELCNGSKSMAPIKNAGKYRIEGKKYIVKDGDIIYFRIGQVNK